MSLQLKMYGVGALALGGFVGLDMADTAMNYEQVPARIVSAERDCFIKERSGKTTESIVDKDGDLAYMPCSIAPMVAAKNNMNESAIQSRQKIAFVYRSPADGTRQNGEHTFKGRADELRKGMPLPIKAHLTEPASYKIR